MTPEQIEQERAAFKAWHKETFGYLPKKYKDGTFMSSSRADEASPQDMFEGWLARAEQGGWISVEDRLPEESGRFLVRYENTSEETPYTTIVRYNAENRTFRSLFLLIDQENPITHWQPLPQPPAGEPT